MVDPAAENLRSCACATGAGDAGDAAGVAGAESRGSRSRRRCRRRMEIVLTLRDDGMGLGVVEVCSEGFRSLSMGDGDRFQFEAFESGPVAAGSHRGKEGSHGEDGSHVCVLRCLKSECDVLLPRNRLRSSRRLDRDLSPVLRICMETTRASLLWQAAAVRPEPERTPSLRSCADSRGVVSHVFGIVRVLLF